MNTSNRAAKHNHSIKSLVIRSALLATLLLSAVSHVQAGGPRDRFGGGEWRLGNHNQIFYRTDRGWQRVQGTAIDVADGWVIGTDRRNGGFGIYRWNGRRFDRMPGGAVDIGGSYECPWVVNNRGERFEWTGRDWREVRSFGSGRGDSRDDRRDDRRNDRRDEWRDEHRDDRRYNRSDDDRDDRRRPGW